MTHRDFKQTFSVSEKTDELILLENKVAQLVPIENVVMWNIVYDLQVPKARTSLGASLLILSIRVDQDHGTD